MFQSEGYHSYYVYILTNKHRTNLYIGVTNNLKSRLEQNEKSSRENGTSFVAKYNVIHLGFYEKFTWVREAIAREKELKGWK